MGRNTTQKLVEGDRKKYPILTNLLSAYLNQDAKLLSGSFEKAVEELIQEAARQKTKIYPELNELNQALNTEKDARIFFSRHTAWSIEGSYRDWFQLLLSRVKAFEAEKHQRYAS